MSWWTGTEWSPSFYLSIMAKTKPTDYPPTPELDRMKAVAAKSQEFGHFLDWLNSEEIGIHLCHKHVHGPTCPGWDEEREKYNPSSDGPRCDYRNNEFYPIDESFEQLLARHFKIDLKKVSKEKDAVYEWLQEQNKKEAASKH